MVLFLTWNSRWLSPSFITLAGFQEIKES